MREQWFIALADHEDQVVFTAPAPDPEIYNGVPDHLRPPSATPRWSAHIRARTRLEVLRKFAELLETQEKAQGWDKPLRHDPVVLRLARLIVETELGRERKRLPALRLLPGVR